MRTRTLWMSIFAMMLFIALMPMPGVAQDTRHTTTETPTAVTTPTGTTGGSPTADVKAADDTSAVPPPVEQESSVWKWLSYALTTGVGAMVIGFILKFLNKKNFGLWMSRASTIFQLLTDLTSAARDGKYDENECALIERDLQNARTSWKNGDLISAEGDLKRAQAKIEKGRHS